MPDIRKPLNCDFRKGKFGVRTIRGEAMPRPYFQASIKSLEALFEQHADETGILAALLDELERRKTPKAINLKGRVVKRLAAKKAGADASNVNPTPRPGGPKQPELPLDATMSTTREILRTHRSATTGRRTTVAPAAHQNVKYRRSASQVV